MADTNFNIKVGTQLNDTLQKQLDASPKKTITVKPILDTKSLQVGTQTVTQYTSALGEVTEATKKVYTNGKEMSNSISKVKSTVDTTSQTLQTASKHTKTLGQDFVSTMGKVAKFGAITAILGAFTGAIGNAVKSVKELDDSLAELRKVSDLSGKGLKDYTDRAFSMARELSTTASNVTDASALFVQAGYSLSESEGLSKYAIMLQSIADDTMDVETASSFLTTTIKSMNLTVADAEHVISAVNQVSNEYAITSNDLSENIGKVAGVANVAGVSYEQLIGLMTSAVSRGSEASKSANAFKSIFINLQQMNESGTMPKLAKQFDEFGISMTDSITGATKTAYELLNELATVYQKVSDSTDVDRQNKMKTLLEDIGGKHNYNVLVNSLEGFDIALSATETAMNSTGSAQKEFQKNLDTIQKKTEGLQGAFQELVWGDGGLNSFIKNLLDGTTGILNFANDTDLLKVALVDLGVILAITVVPNMIKLGSTILATATTALPTAITMWQAYIATQKLGASAMALAGTEAVTLNMALSASIPVIGLVVAGISALVLGINGYNSAQEKAKMQALESLKTFESQNDALLQSIDSIQNEKTSKESLISTISSLNGSYDAEKGKLEDINGLRQDAIDLLYDEAKANAQQTVRETGSQYEKSENFLESDYTRGAYEFETPAKALEFFNKKLDEYNKKIQDGINLGVIDTANLKYFEKEQGRLSKKVEDATAIVEGYNGAKEVLNSTQEQWVKSVQESTEVQNEQNKVTSDAANSTEELAEEQAKAYQEAISGFSDIQSAYDTLSSAMDEYNESGVYSLDTVSKLLALDSEYLSALQLVNGQMTLNEEAIRNKVIAHAEEAKQEIYNIAIADLNAIATGKSAEATDTLATKKSNSSIDIAKQTTALSENNYQLAINNALQAQGQESQDAVNDVIKRTTDSVNAINTAVSGMGVSFEGSMGKASKASSKASKSTKDAWKEAYESDKKELDRNLKTKEISEEEYYRRLDALNEKYFNNSEENHKKYIEDYQKNEEELYTGQEKLLEKRFKQLQENVKKEIDIIEDAKDKALDAIEEEKDAKLDSIDEQLDKLKKQKDEESDYWDEKIDAFKAQNKQLENQNELMRLQEALSKAKATQKMVMTDTGWDYGSDESAVDNAQQAIDDYNQNLAYETQLAELEQSKEDAIAIYDEKIADLEAYRESVSDNYDAQIEQTAEFYDLQITQLQDMVDQYNEQADALLNRQYDEVDDENNNWRTRLENLASFINNYNKILSSLGVSGKKVSSNYNGLTSTNLKKAKEEASTTKGYASGIASVSSNEIAMIGDSPSNRELVIGSKLNGTATMLSQGSGVVNAQSTKSLAGILNTLGSSMGLNGQTMGMNTTNQSNATSQSIQIANITLPSVTNGQGLLDELRGFASGMLQTSYSNG